MWGASFDNVSFDYESRKNYQGLARVRPVPGSRRVANQKSYLPA